MIIIHRRNNGVTGTKGRERKVRSQAEDQDPMSRSYPLVVADKMDEDSVLMMEP